MRAIFKEPGKEPRSLFIPRGSTQLHTLQEIVGGNLEHLVMTIHRENVVLLFDEEGKLKGEEPNIILPWNDVIVGPVIFVGTDQEDFTDCPLTAKEIFDGTSLGVIS